MFLDFEKWHGARNDFIVTWLPPDDMVYKSLVRQAPRLCARDGSGIGADGILVLHYDRRDELNPTKLSIINSDGSVAQTCGNGIRCAASSILRRHREKGLKGEVPEGLELALESSTATCRFMGRGRLANERGNLPLVAVEMGVPRLNEEAGLYESARSEVERVAKELKLPALTQDFAVCELANNHLVFFLEQADRDLLRRVGPALQKSAHWDGINVHLAVTKEVSDKDATIAANSLGFTIEDLYEVLVWERGAGETQACGSGACAVGAAALASGLVSRSEWIGIDMPGGRLYVKQEEPDDQIVLAGPAELSFRGSVEI